MTDVISKPMLFSAPMVLALLNGSKTMTRRVLKKQPTFIGNVWAFDVNGTGRCVDRIDAPDFAPHPVGSQIWVKETWQHDPAGKWGECYRATGHSPLCRLHDHLWRPSIFMPRKYSRITLEVTGVKVERLQDISDGDVAKEGCAWNEPLGTAHGQGNSPAQREFCRLWVSINGKGSCEKNPWVWCYTFKRIKP